MRPRLPVGAQGALVAAAVLLAAAPRVQAQCSMCKTVVTGSEEGRSLGGELNKAILIMVAAPYLVFGGVVAALFRRRLAPALPAAPIRQERARSCDRGAIAQDEERPNSLRAFRTENSGEDRGERPGDPRRS